MAARPLPVPEPHQVVTTGRFLGAQLDETGARLRQLAAAAGGLDERAREVAAGERLLAERQATVERELIAAAVHAAELEEREEALTAEEARLAASAESLAAEAVRLEAESVRLSEQAEQLGQREDRFARRWRWLVRSWRRRRRRPGALQVCDVLFAPTAGGYRLLPQQGLALAPGSLLTGLAGEERSFVVSKISVRPFEGRTCAYLQDVSPSEGVES